MQIRPDAQALYDADFHAWTKEQARLLHAGRFAELDLEHLIEEVDDLGGSQKRAVRSRVRNVIEHLLELEYSPATATRAGWRYTVRTQRSDLDDDLIPTLRREVPDQLAALYARARKRTEDSLRDRGESRAADALPAACPYSFDQIVGDWLPE